jgi:predicted nucleic acid-binding protein
VINIALDTNVLVDAENLNGETKQRQALDLLDRLTPDTTLVPAQALCELYHVLVKKARRSREAADRAVQSWGDTFPIIETSGSVLSLAMSLAAHHQLGVWDAIVLSAAADANCRLLLSEDLQDGFSWSGVTVVNPFRTPMDPLLRSALA